MGKVVLVIVLLACPKLSAASPWSEQARCVGSYGISGIYPTYLIALSAGRASGFLKDRLYAHGLLNEALELNRSARSNAAISRGLSALGPIGEAALLIMWNLDEKCLKAGIDFTFRSSKKTQIGKIQDSFEYVTPDGRRCTASNNGVRWGTSCSPDAQDWLGYMGGDCKLWWSRLRITDDGVEFEHRGPGVPPGGQPEKLPLNPDSEHLGFIDTNGQGWHVGGVGTAFVANQAGFKCTVPPPPDKPAPPPAPAPAPMSKVTNFVYTVDTRTCTASFEGDRWRTSCSQDPQTWIGYRAGDCQVWWSRFDRQRNEFEHRGFGSPPGGRPENLPRHSWNRQLGFIDPKGQGWHVEWNNDRGFVLSRANFSCKL